MLNGKLDYLIVEVKVLNMVQQKMFELLSERSKEVFEKEVVSEHVSGVNLEKEIGVNIDVIEALLPEAIEKASKPIVTEQMLMDLTEVTVIAQSGKAFLVLKKGYQKWIPYSQLYDVEERFEDGQFLQNVPLNEKAEKWMHNKPWDKYKAVKNRG